ncbi:hypothetical protein RRG08_057607, partial [Elysia crispata]
KNSSSLTDVFTRQDLNSGKIEGICSVQDAKEKVIVELKADIKTKTFQKILQFLYTGTPRLSDDAETEELHEVKRVAKIFKMAELVTICENIEREEEFLNPSIGTFLNDAVGAKMKNMFLNKESACDVVFVVDGQKVYAHKAVLTARSDVMAAMFSGSFKESQAADIKEVPVPNATLENFMALLEYLYCDHAPLEDCNDLIGVLKLADENCQTRLVNMCELYISKEVDRACSNRIEKAEIDVVGLLNTAKILNAKQLADFCRHFISTNYDAFSRRKEFSALESSDRKYVQKNRWPPVSYLKELEAFEKEVNKKGEECAVM